MRKILSTSVLLSLVCSGCLLNHVKHPPASIKNQLSNFHKILKPDLLHRGGALLIVPFSAGVGVAADDDLNKDALMIIRGMSRSLEKGNSPFKILDAHNADTAELVIQGRITQKNQIKNFLCRWMPGPREILLGVSGQMIDQKTGETIMLFTHQGKSDLKNLDERKLAEKIGQDIGELILNHIQK